MKKVLFVPINPSSFASMLDLADALIEVDMSADFLLSTRLLQLREAEVLAHGHGIQKAKYTYEYRPPTKWERAGQKLGKHFSLARKFLVSHMARKLRRWPYRERLLVKHLLEKNYSSIVFLGDRHLGIEPMLQTWAQRNSIPMVIAPLMIKGDEHSTLEIRKTAKFDVTENLAFQKNFPLQWRKDPTSGRVYSFYTPLLTEVLARAGLLSRSPWVIGGSGRGVLCVDGLSERQRCLEAGLPPEQIVVTGQAVHDRLLQQKKSLPEAGAKLPLLLLSLPQYAEQKTLTEKEHWREIHWLMGILTDLPARVQISLHPKMNRDIYGQELGIYDVKILQVPLYQCLPSADVFLAINSSTLLWATLCEIPSVLMNFFGLDDAPFRQMKGIKIISDKSELAPWLHLLCQSKDLRLQFKMAQAQARPLISPFDGRCLERISGVLSNHLQSRHL